ncbi:MAG: Asp-tRNA(Asn)/Glu-tRNA(Gln) amidotransferase subunit GatC [Deltaproteobacteria bacterium]|nr:Asp-tRNA(Asn)/Glu-tRNA(Gln) amidotransferase subunit GatC [Deltaproteobacteria bacterium]
MKITKDEIIHVATLARLNLADTDVALYEKQLGDILDYIGTLNRLDTSQVAPTSHAIFINNAFRDDRVKPSIPADRALANAPEPEDGTFIVPRVIR